MEINGNLPPRFQISDCLWDPARAAVGRFSKMHFIPSLFSSQHLKIQIGFCSLPESGFARFFLVQNTKTVENIPNDDKIYQVAIK
jgi:hypothetical protein